MTSAIKEQAHTATPGPWSVTRSKMATDGAFDYAISAGEVLVIAEAFGRDAKGGWPPAEANARLIAAAPDLLDALKWAENALAPFSKEPAEKSGIALIRAAIARAMGEAK